MLKITTSPPRKRSPQRGIPLITWFLLLLFSGACSERNDAGKEANADQSVEEQAKLANELRERILAEGGDEADWKQALELDPRGLFAAIQGIEDPDTRADRMSSFFRWLAETDPHLARDLLPKDLSYREQDRWVTPVARGLKKVRDMRGAAELIYAKFPGEGRRNAIQNCIGGGSFEDDLAFWNFLEEGEDKDAAVGSLAWVARWKTPEEAIGWYESVEPHLKEYAVDTIADAPAKFEDASLYLSIAKDPALRSKLAITYGRRLRWKEPEMVAASLAKLPDDLFESAETAYIKQLVNQEGGNPSDVDGVRKYFPQLLSEEGREAAHRIIAMDEFQRMPERGVEMLVETGLHEKDEPLWEMFMRSWLEADGMAASEYIAELPPGPSQQIGIKQMVRYLRDIGDKEAAQAWRERIESP